ncbi:hypothetical protein Bca4012_026530 [Brassica carinata]|uniref:Uncharacterized protein n=1 Tax=Brassica carinata TaxID=52824 RepID=A0A8X7VIH3_BRACI|nr:hypothetical protein Bca52824_023562 [Brassica carinata]
MKKTFASTNPANPAVVVGSVVVDTSSGSAYVHTEIKPPPSPDVTVKPNIPTSSKSIPRPEIKIHELCTDTAEINNISSSPVRHELDNTNQNIRSPLMNLMQDKNRLSRWINSRRLKNLKS